MNNVTHTQDVWIAETIDLIRQGLSNEEITKRVPFRSDYVKNLRDKLN